MLSTFKDALGPEERWKMNLFDSWAVESEDAATWNLAPRQFGLAAGIEGSISAPFAHTGEQEEAFLLM